MEGVGHGIGRRFRKVALGFGRRFRRIKTLRVNVLVSYFMQKKKLTLITINQIF